jgi:serine/threonine protein phosphatase PrpC
VSAGQAESRPVSAPIRTSWGAATDRGRRRADNQDALLASPPVFVVADGMGGHEHGAAAAAAAVSSFAELAGRATASSADLLECLRSAGALVDALSATSAGGAAGTTVTAVAVGDEDGVPYWVVLNLGDSRTYRLSGGELVQISIDHSEVQELVDSGQLAAEMAQLDPRRNVVTRALGAYTAPEPDLWLIPAETGDRLLLCSDGLTNELSDARIRAVLLGVADPDAAARALVAEAVVAGGRDNVTVVVVDALEVAGQGTDLDTAPALDAAAPDEIEEVTLPSVARKGEGA